MLFVVTQPEALAAVPGYLQAIGAAVTAASG